MAHVQADLRDDRLGRYNINSFYSRQVDTRNAVEFRGEVKVGDISGGFLPLFCGGNDDRGLHFALECLKVLYYSQVTILDFLVIEVIDLQRLSQVEYQFLTPIAL